MKSKNLFVVAAVVFLSACSNSGNEFDASGVFEATEVIVSAQANGELMRFDVKEGAQLKAGVAIGYIDTTQLSLRRLQLLSSMQAVESRQYNVAVQVASLEQQIATQRNERRRFEKLVESNAANQKQVDDIDAQIEVLQKQLVAQRENLEKGNRGVSGESSSLAMQVAQIDDQIRRSYVCSPIDGVVLSKYAERGEFAAQGRSLFKVADIGNMELRAYITADLLTEIKIGQAVKVYADQGKSERREYAGTLIWISDKAEFTPKTIQTRNERANLVYAVKVAVKNDGYIKKGMYGEIKLK